MDNLRKNFGYTSLKIKHAERQAKMFPSLIGLPGELSSETELGNLWHMEDKESPDDPFGGVNAFGDTATVNANENSGGFADFSAFESQVPS